MKPFIFQLTFKLFSGSTVSPESLLCNASDNTTVYKTNCSTTVRVFVKVATGLDLLGFSARPEKWTCVVRWLTEQLTKRSSHANVKETNFQIVCQTKSLRSLVFLFLKNVSDLKI